VGQAAGLELASPMPSLLHLLKAAAKQTAWMRLAAQAFSRARELVVEVKPEMRFSA